MLRQAIKELKLLLTNLESLSFSDDVEKAANLLAAAFQSGNKLLLVGNGGSAAEAQHMAAEYTGTLNSKNFRVGYPAVALTTDTSFLTAWSNDFGLEQIFSRQVQTLGCPGDVLLSYSTSGNSVNILRAVEAAKSKSMLTIGFCGNDGGALVKVCDMSFSVPSLSTTRIQEIHTLLGHTICAQVENILGDIKK